MHIQPPTPRSVPVVRARRGAIVSATALACAALLSACGSSSSSSTTSTAASTNLNTARVARSIEESVLAQRKLHVAVVCPTAVPQEAGKTFECIATGHSTKAPFAETKTPFVVTIQNSKGYVTYVGK